MEDRLAARLAELRIEQGWSLEDLARRTDISRSTLSRLERGEISPTATLLGKLCTAYERTMSRLLAEVESEPPQVLRADEQAVWRDETSGYTRRSVSPPTPACAGEVVEATLRPGADIAYDQPPVPGLEQHLWVHDGALEVTANGQISLYVLANSYAAAPGGFDDSLAERLGLVARIPLVPTVAEAQMKFVVFVPVKEVARVQRAAAEAGAGVVETIPTARFDPREPAVSCRSRAPIPRSEKSANWKRWRRSAWRCWFRSGSFGGDCSGARCPSL